MTSTSLRRILSTTRSGRRRLGRDPASTATVIVGLVTVAAIHWAQVIPTSDATPLLGSAFVILCLACVCLAATLLVSDLVVAWLGVGVVNALAIGGYVFTRTVSTSFDSQDVGNWGETLGMVALLVETLLIALSVYRLLDRGVLYASGAPPRYEAQSVDRYPPGYGNLVK